MSKAKKSVADMLVERTEAEYIVIADSLAEQVLDCCRAVDMRAERAICKGAGATYASIQVSPVASQNILAVDKVRLSAVTKLRLPD